MVPDLAEALVAGDYLTDGSRLVRVTSLTRDGDGYWVEDAATDLSEKLPLTAITNGEWERVRRG